MVFRVVQCCLGVSCLDLFGLLTGKVPVLPGIER